MGNDSDEQKKDQPATPDLAAVKAQAGTGDQAAKPPAEGADAAAKPAAKAADGKAGKAGKVRRPAGPPAWLVWSLLAIILVFFGVMCYFQAKRWGWIGEKAPKLENEYRNVSQETKDRIDKVKEQADAAIKSKAPPAERRILLEAAKAEINSIRDDLDKFEKRAQADTRWTQDSINQQMKEWGAPDLILKIRIINDEVYKIVMDNLSSEAPFENAPPPPAPSAPPAAPAPVAPNPPAPPAAAEPGAAAPPAAPPAVEPKPAAPAPAPAPVGPPVAEPKPAPTP